jgi:hypothetical protein
MNATGQLPDPTLTITFIPTSSSALLAPSCDTEQPQRFDVFVNGAAEPAETLMCAGGVPGSGAIVAPSMNVRNAHTGLLFDPQDIAQRQPVTLTIKVRAAPPNSTAAGPEQPKPTGQVAVGVYAPE